MAWRVENAITEGSNLLVMETNVWNLHYWTACGLVKKNNKLNSLAEANLPCIQPWFKWTGQSLQVFHESSTRTSKPNYYIQVQQGWNSRFQVSFRQPQIFFHSHQIDGSNNQHHQPGILNIIYLLSFQINIIFFLID